MNASIHLASSCILKELSYINKSTFVEQLYEVHNMFVSQIPALILLKERYLRIIWHTETSVAINPFFGANGLLRLGE
jgi:hypothetical protein